MKLCRALIALLPIVLSGCVEDPVVAGPDALFESSGGVVVLNEGVWRMDNASLTLYDPIDDRTVQSWFAAANPGERIGDTGNRLYLRGDRLYVVLSESSTVELLSLPDGTSLGRLRLPSGVSPRGLSFVNDTLAWVTALDDDAIYRWNPRDLTWSLKVATGPAPEGIAYAAGRIFVANSGLGALRADEEGAGTIGLYDGVSGQPVGLVDPGGNLQDIWHLPSTGRLYTFAGTVLPDTTTGGIVEIDPVTLQVTNRWDVPGAWTATFDPVAEEIYLVSHKGVHRLPLPSPSHLVPPDLDLFLARNFSTLTDEVPHSIAVSPRTGEIYLGFARGYFQAPGRVDRFSRDGELLGRFEVGLNPIAILFY